MQHESESTDVMEIQQELLEKWANEPSEPLHETPIAACEAIFTAYQKKQSKSAGDKIYVSFLINPIDAHDGLATAELGTIFKLYVTRPAIGI